MIIVYILCAMLLLAALWLLTMRTKRKKEDFFGLAKFHYAHRGLHGNGIPENSLAAFSLAVNHGFGAELDVHLTKDHRLVVIHDKTLKRTTGAEGMVEDATLKELKSLNLEGTQEKIPLLQEVLPLFEGKAPLIIEIKAVKGNHAELTRRVCELLVNYPKLKFCIESFDPRVLRWLKKHRPNIIRGQLSCDFVRRKNGLPLVLAVLLTNLSLNFWTVPHFIAYRFEDRSKLALRICRKIWGVQEFSWTIKSKADAKTALADGAPIIFEHIQEDLCTIN